MHGCAHAAASRETTRPAATGGKPENPNPEREESLPGGLAAPRRNTAGGRRAHKFPRPGRGEARKPPPPACAGPAQGKRGLRPWRAPRPGSRRSRKRKDAASRFPTSREGAGGAGSGGGARRRAAPSQPRICFHFRPHNGEDAGRCSLASGRKSACGGRGRAERPTRRRCREARGLQVPTARAPPPPRRRRREPAGASRAPRPRAGPRCPRADTRLPTRAVPPSRRPAASRPTVSASRHAATYARRPAVPPARPPSAPRRRDECVRGVARDTGAVGRPFVSPQTEGAPVGPLPPAPLASPWRWL